MFVGSGPAAANIGTTAGAKTAAYNLGVDGAPLASSEPKNILNLRNFSSGSLTTNQSYRKKSQ